MSPREREQSLQDPHADGTTLGHQALGPRPALGAEQAAVFEQVTRMLAFPAGLPGRTLTVNSARGQNVPLPNRPKALLNQKVHAFGLLGNSPASESIAV
jgi:hypothetical protein